MAWNPTFKRPESSTYRPERSPTPPHRFVEPLSPEKPRPIEPNFNYPAINNHVDFTVRPEQAYNGTPKARDRSGSHRSGHHRTPSTIDALADAALATSPSFQPHVAHAGVLQNGHPHAHPMPSGHGRSEPPHKRARSELLPSPMVTQYASRPATSYEQSNHWYRGPMQQTQPGESYETRIEEASLLLNFRTGGFPPSNPLGPPPIMGAPTAPRPHANSFPQDTYQPRGIDLASQAGLLPPFNPHYSAQPRPTLPSPQQTIDDTDASPYRVQPAKQEDAVMQNGVDTVLHERPDVHMRDAPQQTQTPPDEVDSRAQSTDVVMSETSEPAAKKPRGWPKGKPRGSSTRKSVAEKAATRRAASRKKTPDASRASRGASEAVSSVWEGVREVNKNRRKSFSDAHEQPSHANSRPRARSVPPDVPMVIRSASPSKAARRTNKITIETICAGCEIARETTKLNPELDEWVSCNGCKKWFHVDCAGFKKASEVRDVDKFFCTTCEPVHGKTTYVRKSTRAHAQVDYAELQRGVLKTSEESMEHHYIQPIKDGTFEFDPESFPRMRPELVTREFFEKSNTFVEPICIPTEWNPRPCLRKKQKAAAGAEDCQDHVEDLMSDMVAEEFEYDAVPNDGQDKLGMVMPEELTVRQVCNLVGPEIPLDVIDVKTQNSGAKWTLGRWADYYEEDGEEKPIRNVISLEVSQSKLGRLLRRPQVVRDIDLQDEVWPQKETDQGKWPKVQFYCLMSVADSYTDFHIDFGGSSVYYHILKGKKTFFFIPPKAKHLKAYEEWNDSPQQNYTFLPSITKECYRVDLSEGDTMLIPSGWIHAVWTPETSLVIGGNFLNRMSYKNQFKVVDIEKANETPMKFRYPYFQKIMWYTAIKYLTTDPLPEAVSRLFFEGKQFERQRPIWAEFDTESYVDDPRPGAKNTRYYGQAEVEGLPDLVNFIFRTVMLVMGRIEGVSQDRMKRVNASIPKGHGEPLEVAKTFALWVAWKRGNEDPPAWAHPDAVLPNSKDFGPPKKLSARALKEMERKEAIAASRIAPERQSERVKNAAVAASASTSANGPGATPDRTSANGIHHQTSQQQSSNAPTQPVAHHEMHAPAPPVAHPMAMAMNAMPGQYISTPKTSVLGPKRVACDACRKRRIRCKHKDIVMQATSGSPMQQMSPNSYRTSELLDNITVTPPKQRQSFDQVTNSTNGQQGANGHVMQNGDVSNGLPLANGQTQPTPGTNAYLNANIPMTVNGVPMFGEMPKRGRSKACFECRKSKRRCVHDENGNVDPVKAAETPVPRGTVSSKKRPAEDGTPSQPKKKIHPNTPSNRGPSPSVFNQHSQPNGNDAKPVTYNMHNGRPIQPQIHRPEIASTTENRETQDYHQQTQPPIDPNLFAYSEPADNGPYGYSAPERPSLYQLPSLEQIANEVLDMNGRSYEDFQDSTYDALVNSESQTNGFAYEQAVAAALSNGLAGNESSRPDESVDSAVSLPGSDVAEQNEKQKLVDLASSAQAFSEPPTHKLDSDTINVTRPYPQAESHQNGTPIAQTSIEPDESNTASQTSPDAQRSNAESLPLYKPPAPLSQSPEQTKRQPALTNGLTSEARPADEEGNKRRRDSESDMPGSEVSKKVKIS